MKTHLVQTLVFLALLTPVVRGESTFYMIQTGQTGANTTIDSAHTTQWISPFLTASCPAGVDCETVTVAAFRPSFAWFLGGGSFELKRGSSTSADISLQLWEGTASGSPLASVSLAATAVSSNAYDPALFLFLAAVKLQPGHDYLVTLTSPASIAGNVQYFIKSPGNVTIRDSIDGNGNPLPSGVVPEPATWSVGILALAALAARYRRAVP